MFALEIVRGSDNDLQAIDSVNNFNDRVNRVNGAQFFNGFAQFVPLNDAKALIVVDLTILTPPINYVFGMGLLFAMFFKSITGSIVMGILFLLFSFFRLKYFYAWLYKKGLKKVGYTDKARVL